MFLKIEYVKYLVCFLLGAFLVYFLFKGGEDKTIYTEKVVTTTDTLIVSVKDTVFINKEVIKQKIVRDTVLVNYRPKIRAFKTLSPSLYGDISINGEVLGELLKMSVVTNFKIPTITNSIVTTKSTVTTKTPQGIYLGGSVNNLFEPALKADYLNDQFIFSYQYNILDKSHQIGVSKKLF